MTVALSPGSFVSAEAPYSAVDPGAPEFLLSPRRITWTGHPEPLRRRDYDEAAAAYLEQARRVPGVVGVVRFGRIAEPGISDLDLLVLTEPQIPAGSGATLSHLSLPAHYRRVFTHEPFVVPLDGYVHFWENLERLELEPLWGRVPELAPGDVGEELRRGATLAERACADLVQFARIAHSRSADARRVLLTLRSLCFSLEISSDLLRDHAPAWRPWGDALAELRGSWFQHGTPPLPQLSKLAAEGWRLAAELAASLGRWMDAQVGIPEPQFGSAFRSQAWETIATSPAQTAERILSDYLAMNRPFAPHLLALWGSRRLRRLHCVPLPRCICPLLSATLHHAPLLGPRIRSSQVAGPRLLPLPPGLMGEALAARARRAGRQAEYQARNGLTLGTPTSGVLRFANGRPPGVRSRLLWRTLLHARLNELRDGGPIASKPFPA